MGRFINSGCALFGFLLVITISCSSSSFDHGNGYFSYELEDDGSGRSSNKYDQFVSYKYSPLQQLGSGGLSREKRAAAEELDKSILTKGNLSTKKPTMPVLKAKDSNNVKEVVTTEKKQEITNTNSSSSMTTTATPNNTKSSETTMKVFPSIKGSNGSLWLNMTEDDENGVVEFPKEIDRDSNATTFLNHTYYNSTFYRDGQFLWLELDDIPEAENHTLLSDAHRRAATVKLLFEFPFYGHRINNVTLATGGFLYLGPHVHAWLAATQYVAPLMANFDSRHDNASVKYLSNATQLTVEWKNVRLHDAPDNGSFTFQTTLQKNGNIIFAYKHIPIDILSVNDSHHPVKVGLSDAYISERHILFVKQKTIYEYHRVDLTNMTISNGSAIVFTALPTCQNYTSCEECTNHETEFDCVWCPSAQRCSDGTDRHRQEWLMKNCSNKNVKLPVECHLKEYMPTPHSDIYHGVDEDDHHEHDFDKFAYPHQRSEPLSPNNSPSLIAPAPREASGMSASGVFGILFFIVLIVGIAGWIFYAYTRPHTPSGQLLIRFRPSQWGAFRRGEARYTAASIHM